MGFLAPWFLVGLVGLGLPVWLHLLRRHKTVPQPFASLMFFERRTQSSVKHRRLRYLLLFALRLALLLLLCLLFAQPYWRTSATGAGGQRVVIYVVDHTFSMRAGNLLERAKDDARQAVGAGARGQVLALGQGIEVLTQPAADADALRAAISSLTPGDGRATFGDLARYLRTANTGPAQVHVFSDFQKSALPPAFNDLALPAGTELVPHPLKDIEAKNWSVESVVAPGLITDPKKVQVEAVIAGRHTPLSRQPVSLVINGKTVANAAADVPENGRGTVKFTGFDAGYGLNRAEIRIDSGDRFPADDIFRFALERVEPRRVLYAHESRQARSVLYVRAALESAGDSPFVLETSSCDLTAQLNPSQYAFVVLADCGSVPAAFEQALKRYVEGGGDLLLILGPASAAAQRAPVAGFAVREARYASRDGERFLGVASVDTGHPVMNGHNSLEGARFFQTIRFDAAGLPVVAKLTDGAPLLTASKIGQGNLLVLASPLDNLANDLPLHTGFVPFIERTANYLGGARERASSVVVGTTAELRAGPAPASAEVIDPAGRAALGLQQSGARSFTFPGEGFWEVRRAGGRAELYAVNADRRESDLAPLENETLELWKNTGKGDASPSGASTSAGNSPALQNPWRGVLAVLLLIVLAESWLASRYLAESPQDEAKQEAA